MSEKKVDAKIREEIWKRVGPELEQGVKLFVQHGAKVKGMKPKEALAHVLCDIVKLAYVSGLDRGYDMGHKVFGDGDD